MDIKKIIDKNNKIIDDINQYLHNKGVNINSRLDIIINVLNNNINNECEKNIKSMIESIFIDKSELCQRLYMSLGSQLHKQKLDQFYTPCTIGKFISSIILNGKCIIDPACGTGDLVIDCNSIKTTLWDISTSVLELTKLNYKFRSKNITNLIQIDSIYHHNKDNKLYDYCMLNPPFGNKTVISDSKILNKYNLGKKLKKQEIGVLFIERALNLLNNNGILFVIVPNGYLGNQSSENLRNYILVNYTLLAVIELPDNTFGRSGTGVSTSLLIIKNIKLIENYKIFIKVLDNIGYDLSKKNTPIKYKKNENYEYVLDENNNPIVLSDFPETILQFLSYSNDNNIIGFKETSRYVNYDFVYRNEIQNSCILSARRYYNKYTSIILNGISNNLPKVKDYILETNFTFKKINPIYKYVDLSSVKKCMYHYTEYSINELPERAKFTTKKDDIIVSRLKGKINFSIILEDDIIVSNGFIVLRPKSYTDALIIFGNLFKNDFYIQHRSLVTGSIMETISDNDFLNIYINNNIDIEKCNKIVRALIILKEELSYN